MQHHHMAQYFRLLHPLQSNMLTGCCICKEQSSVHYASCEMDHPPILQLKMSIFKTWDITQYSVKSYN